MAKVKQRGLGRGLSALFDDADVDPQRITANSFEEARIDAPDLEGGERILKLPIGEIAPNTSQPRTEFDESAMGELAASIEEHGILQPILVRPSAHGYEIIAGERRYRAARMAGLQEVPAIVRTMSEQENLLVALIENMQREDLNAIEEARGLQELSSAHGLTQKDIAKRIGKSRPYVANALRLLALPGRVQNLVERGQLSAGHARAIAGIEGEERQIAAAEHAVRHDLSVRDMERYARKKPARAKRPRRLANDAHVQRVEESLSTALGTRVRLVGTDEKGKIEVDYYSRDELERLLAVLMEQ